MTDNLTDDLSHIPQEEIERERKDYFFVRQKIIDAIESGATKLEVFRKDEDGSYEYISITQLPPEFAQLAPNLTHLTLRNFSRLENIAPLKQCNKLQHLELRGCKQLSDITPLSGLKQLQYLDLKGCKELSDIKPLSGLVQLQHLDLSSCDELGDIRPLSGLVQLQSLNLSWCEQLSDIEPLSSLVQLQHLNLGSCDKLSDITPLSDLVQLQYLCLERCDELSGIRPLAGLVQLQSLDLRGCDELSDIRPLSGLVQLQHLNLRRCRQISEIEPLSGLVQLQQLNLSWCSELIDIKPLSGLVQLQRLDLEGCEQLSDIEPLSDLLQLQQLNLNRCYQLSDIEPLSGLEQLQCLDLFRCSELSSIEPLSGLVQLQQLNLSWCSELIDIKPLSGLVQLQHLDLTGSKQLSDIRLLSDLAQLKYLNLRQCDALSDIKPLSSLGQLQYLNLSECSQLSDLTPLVNMTHLEWLDIAEAINHIPFTTLQALLKLPKLTRFSANNLHIPGVPFELTKNISDFQVLRDWYADVQQGFVPSNRIKLHLLGNGRIGKTQLARRLANKSFDAGIASTHGIQINTWPMQIAISLPDEQGESNEPQYRETEITVCNWDFGGQDVYLSTHSLFLDDQAVYAVLWHPDYENTEVVEVPALPVIPVAPESSQSKELVASPDNPPTLQLRNRHLSYWLAYLHSLVGSNAPVIVAQSQCDNPEQCQTAPLPHDLPFDFLKTSHCSAMNTVDGLDELLPALKSALKLQQQRIGEVMIPTSWMRVADVIEELKQQGQKTLNFDDYLALCDGSNNGDSSAPAKVSAPKTLLQYLHNSGQVFYKQGLFNNQLILDQSWALQGVYSLLERGSSLPALVRNEGKFTLPDLQDWLWHKAGYSDDEQDLFLEMMQQCGICFVIEKSDWTKGIEAKYLAPDCLPKREQLTNAIAGVWRKERPGLQVQLHYDFLHDAVARQVLCSIGTKAGSGAHYWRYGCCFYALEYGTNFELNCVFYHEQPERFQEQARLEDLLQNHGQPGFIEITATGDDAAKAKRFVESIVRSIVRGHRLSREPSVQWLLGFDEQKGQNQREHHDQSGNSGNGEMPQFTAGINADREQAQPSSAKVYLSYAWGKGEQQHQAVADQIADALDAEPDIQLMRDKDVMKTGDSIKRFEQAIGQAYQVVVIFSEKSLKSEHCMRELLYLQQTSLSDEASFQQRVIPVVLGEVNIDTAPKRLQYVKHWRELADSMEQDAQGISDPELTAEVNLYRDIANSLFSSLKWSADICIERNWDAAQNDNFAELIELVKQRIRENQQRLE